MSPAAGSDQTTIELRRALEDVARLAWDGVPGCDGASVSLLRDGTARTLSATQDWIRALDARQY